LGGAHGRGRERTEGGGVGEQVQRDLSQAIGISMSHELRAARLELE